MLLGVRVGRGGVGSLPKKTGAPHRADSRALGLERGSNNVGPISTATAAVLASKGVSVPARHRLPRQACDAGFRVFDLIIALKEAEFPPHPGCRMDLVRRVVRSVTY